MKIFALAAAALLATVAYAAPASVEARTDEVLVTFTGAGGAYFTQLFPVDGSLQPIGNQLSVSQITVPRDGVTGTFNGIDGSVTVVVGPGTEPVGPPQTQVSGSLVYT